MANWTTPVYDRTQEDVEYAVSQLTQNINVGEYKGCFNVSDITRIENNSRYLADKLMELYYFNGVYTPVTWNKTSFVFLDHVNRIINNVAVLCNSYHRPPGVDDIPESLVTFEQVNTVEQYHHLIKTMLDKMISDFRECNSFECGEA